MKCYSTGIGTTHPSDKRSFSFQRVWGFSLIFTLSCQHLWQRSNLCHVYSKPYIWDIFSRHVCCSVLLLFINNINNYCCSLFYCPREFFPRKAHINVDIMLSNLYSGYIFWETGNRVLQLRCI